LTIRRQEKHRLAGKKLAAFRCARRVTDLLNCDPLSFHNMVVDSIKLCIELVTYMSVILENSEKALSIIDNSLLI